MTEADERTVDGSQRDTSSGGAPRSAALFDIDGTLIDTTFLHTTMWWQAFRSAGLTVPMARIQRAIGMDSDHMLDHLLGRDRDREKDSKLSAAHGALFAQYWPALTPFDGAVHLLRACKRRGWSVVLATSAHEDELAAMRGALDAEAVIDAVTGADDVSSGKPAPDLVEQALERAGVPAERAVFIGDTRWDVEAAGRAGVPCIGVLSGGWSRAELFEAGAAQVFESVTDLLAKMDASLLAEPSARAAHAGISA